MTDKINENLVDNLLKTESPMLPEKDFCKSILSRIKRNKLRRLVILTPFYILAIGVIVIYTPKYNFLNLLGLELNLVIPVLVFPLILILLTEIRRS